MPKPSRRIQDFVEEEYALEFESYEDLEAAVRILEAWDGQIELLHRCGREGQENGKALQKYGGESMIEGRIRQLVGGEFSVHADILVMQTRSGGISAALSRSEAIIGKILQTLRESNPEEFLAFIKEHPPASGLMVREKAQAAIDKAKARLEELENGDDPEYDGERHDVERTIEFETRVLAVKPEEDECSTDD